MEWNGDSWSKVRKKPPESRKGRRAWEDSAPKRSRLSRRNRRKVEMGEAKPLTPPRKPLTPPRKLLTPPRKLLTPPRKPLAPPRKPLAPTRKPLAPPRKPLAPPRKPLTPPRKLLAGNRRLSSWRRLVFGGSAGRSAFRRLTTQAQRLRRAGPGWRSLCPTVERRKAAPNRLTRRTQKHRL